SRVEQLRRESLAAQLQRAGPSGGHATFSPPPERDLPVDALHVAASRRAETDACVFSRGSVAPQFAASVSALQTPPDIESARPRRPSPTTSAAGSRTASGGSGPSS